MVYNALGASAISSDLVIVNGNDTYICVMNPAAIDHLAQTPVEQQPGWQIKLYRVSIDSQTGIERTQTLYPEGSDKYNFAPSNIANYNWKYRL